PRMFVWPRVCSRRSATTRSDLKMIYADKTKHRPRATLPPCLLFLAAAGWLVAINKNSRTVISDLTKKCDQRFPCWSHSTSERYGRGRGDIPPNALKALSVAPLHEALMLIVFGDDVSRDAAVTFALSRSTRSKCRGDINHRRNRRTK